MEMCKKQDKENECQIQFDTTPKSDVPKKYRVLLVNDDFTPAEYVVMLLQEYFFFSSNQAYNTMLAAHRGGAVVCGEFTKDVAETKAGLVMDAAHSAGHPLLCKTEAV